MMMPAKVNYRGYVNPFLHHEPTCQTVCGRARPPGAPLPDPFKRLRRARRSRPTFSTLRIRDLDAVEPGVADGVGVGHGALGAQFVNAVKAKPEHIKLWKRQMQ